MSNEFPIAAWYIANCGVLVQYQNHKLLVDGLFTLPEPDPGFKAAFCVPDEETIRSIMNRKGLFENLDILLFTHRHWDHCSERLAQEFSERYGLPVLFPSAHDEDTILENDWVRIESLMTIHDIAANPDHQKHCCFRVTLGGMVLLFTGDLDVHVEIPEKLTNATPDVLFLNVHQILIPEGRSAVTECFRPKLLFIQHIPAAGTDSPITHRRLTNKMKVYGSTLPPCTLLTEPLTRIL